MGSWGWPCTGCSGSRTPSGPTASPSTSTRKTATPSWPSSTPFRVTTTGPTSAASSGWKVCAENFDACAEACEERVSRTARAGTVLAMKTKDPATPPWTITCPWCGRNRAAPEAATLFKAPWAGRRTPGTAEVRREVPRGDGVGRASRGRLCGRPGYQRSLPLPGRRGVKTNRIAVLKQLPGPARQGPPRRSLAAPFTRPPCTSRRAVCPGGQDLHGRSGPAAGRGNPQAVPR